MNVKKTCLTLLISSLALGMITPNALAPVNAESTSHRVVSVSHAQTYHQKVNLTRYAHRQIRNARKKYNYWNRKDKREDKILDPIFWQNTPKEKRAYHLDGAYYARATYYDNVSAEYSAILYGLKYYPLSRRPARQLIQQLAKYKLRQRNQPLIEYLIFSQHSHAKPSYHYHKWSRQLSNYIYEQ